MKSAGSEVGLRVDVIDTGEIVLERKVESEVPV